jgi:hypothetical protein
MFNFRASSAMLAVALVATPLAAFGAEGTWSGRVVHISVDNIKVRNADGKIMSFLIVPRFRKVYGKDAHVTRDLKDVHRGDRVLVRYDQHFLGVRHADAIFDGEYPLMKMKG